MNTFSRDRTSNPHVKLILVDKLNDQRFGPFDSMAEADAVCRQWRANGDDLLGVSVQIGPLVGSPDWADIQAVSPSDF